MGHTATWLRGTAERGVVTTSRASVLEFDEVAFGVPNDRQSGMTTRARMGADDFGRLTVLVQELRTFHSWPHAGGPHRLTLGANHGNRIVGFERIQILCRLNTIEHEHMLTGFHRFHVRPGVRCTAGSDDCHGKRKSRQETDFGEKVVCHFY